MFAVWSFIIVATAILVFYFVSTCRDNYKERTDSLIPANAAKNMANGLVYNVATILNVPLMTDDDETVYFYDFAHLKGYRYNYTSVRGGIYKKGFGISTGRSRKNVKSAWYYGTVAVTNKRIVFMGGGKTIQIPMPDINATGVTENVVEIVTHKDIINVKTPHLAAFNRTIHTVRPMCTGRKKAYNVNLSERV